MAIKDVGFAALLGTLAIGLPATGMAQGTEVASFGWYIGGSAGISSTKFNSAGFSSDLAGAGLTNSVSGVEEEDKGFKLFAGYRFNRHFGLEASYLDLGSFSVSTVVTRVNGIAVVPQTVVGSINIKEAFSLAAIGVLPLGGSRFSLLGKLGVYSIKTEARLTGPAGFLSDSDRNQNLLVGLGASYDFASKFGVRAEWERFLDVGSDSVGKGDIDMMSIGLVYRF